MKKIIIFNLNFYLLMLALIGLRKQIWTFSSKSWIIAKALWNALYYKHCRQVTVGFSPFFQNICNNAIECAVGHSKNSHRGLIRMSYGSCEAITYYIHVIHVISILIKPFSDPPELCKCIHIYHSSPLIYSASSFPFSPKRTCVCLLCRCVRFEVRHAPDYTNSNYRFGMVHRLRNVNKYADLDMCNNVCLY